jgi:hypothetical protein
MPNQPIGDAVEVSIKGKWSRVPALEINGLHLIVKGKWMKQAIVHNEEWLAKEVENPEVCVSRLKDRASHRLRADVFTFSQRLPAIVPKFEYPLEWDSVAAIRISTFKHWWEDLPQESRKNVRRSQKRGATVSIRELDDDLVRQIVDVNNDCPMRQKRRFDHYGKTFDQVKKDQYCFAENSDFICAQVNDELIGFLKLVYTGGVASILQLLPKAGHYDKRPANALIAKAVELCETKGVSFLRYGRFNYGNKRESTLRDFKERNGFKEVLTPRFYVPLTTWGSVCVKAGLHRGLIGILPHSTIAAGLRVRATSYSFLSWASRCSSMAEQPNRTRQTGCSNPPAGSNFNPS